MEPLDLFEKLRELFPTCFFTHKGKSIKVHEESSIDGLPVYNFTRFKFPYKVGLHYKFSDYIESNGYFAELNKNGELIIKQ